MRARNYSPTPHVATKSAVTSLQGNVATELKVFRFVDHTHPPPPILRRMR